MGYTNGSEVTSTTTIFEWKKFLNADAKSIFTIYKYSCDIHNVKKENKFNKESRMV